MDLHPEVDMQIESEIIEAKTRKLKAVWTYEAYNLPWGFKSRRPKFRSLDDDWEVQKID